MATGGSDGGFGGVPTKNIPEVKKKEIVIKLPESLSLKVEPDPFSGFGIQRVDNGFVGISGQKDTGINNNDLKNMEIISFVNSTDGIFNFNSSLDKYKKIKVDIINPIVKNVGFPHWSIEDTFEWVNSGKPSHLSQVSDANLINMELRIEREFPGLQGFLSKPYQSKFIVPCDRTWYDSFNSTIDYNEELKINNFGLSLPYVTSVIYIKSINKIWAGGPGGVLSIDINSLVVISINIPFSISNFVVDLKQDGNDIFILTDKDLFIYNLLSNVIIKDEGFGLPDRLYVIHKAKTGVLVIGTENGIYIKKQEKTKWTNAILSSPIRFMSNPDVIFAISDEGTLFGSQNGILWFNKGNIFEQISSVINVTTSNDIKKATITDIIPFSVSMWIISEKTLYRDDGTFRTQLPTLTKTEIFSSNFPNTLLDFDSKLYVGLSDGRYGFITGSIGNPGTGTNEDGTEVNTKLFSDSNLASIHKMLDVDGELWFFGYDKFTINNKDGIFRLATGQRV